MEKLVGLTHTKQVEEVLSETNTQLQVLQQVTAAVHGTLDLEEIFKKITDGAVHLLGYTTALILILNESEKCFRIKAISTNKHILPQISKILGFPVKKLFIPEDSSFQDNVRSLLKGEVIISKNLSEVAYPMIGKKACSALQKLGKTKNYILVPLEGEKEVIGAVFIASPRAEVSAEELRMIEAFAHVSSDAIKNAGLLIHSKQSEEALRQSEKKLKAYLESAPDGVYLTDLKGTFLYGNKKAEELTGYAREELIGKSFLKLNLLPGKYLARAAKLLVLSAMGKPTGPDEFEITKRDGNRIWVEINTTLIKQAGGTIVIGFVRDITERKHIEEALRFSDAAFKSIQESVIATDTEYIITRWNKVSEQIYGVKASEAIGKKLFDVIEIVETLPSENAKRFKKLETQGYYQEEQLHRTKHAEVWVDVSVQAIETNGRHYGWVALATDITERKQAEEREKQLQQELILASRLASIGEMASGVAHEINNPLTGVIGFAQLLMRRDIADDIREDLEVINKEAQRVAEVVSGLLAFAHQRKPGREYVDINQLILEILKLRSCQMQVNNIHLVNRLDPDLPQTVADGNQLQQVFLNIILNAEQAMVKAHGGGNLSVKTEQVNDSIQVSVADDGPGISQENLDKVFNPFFTTNEVGQGTGLGLSICHGIVTQHNGKISAKSKLGKGATFIVELPIVADTERKGKPKVMGKETLKREGVKILVVDDEGAILNFLNHLLSKWGYEVETVDNVNDALDRLKGGRYDLILMDVKMPVMSGMDLYRHIEATDSAQAQRVMFITGDVMGRATGDFLNQTGVPYITKPFNIEHLRNSIDQILTKELVQQR